MSPFADFLRCAPAPALNDASYAELLAVNEIGHRLAARLIAARPFGNWDAVLAVRGVGPRALRNVQAAFPRLNPLSIPPPTRATQPRSPTMNTREIFDNYCSAAIVSIKRDAFLHAIRETSKRRPPTLADVVELLCDEGLWGRVDLDDSVTVGDLLGVGHDDRLVAELLDQLLPPDLDVDPDDPLLERPVSQLFRAN